MQRRSYKAPAASFVLFLVLALSWTACRPPAVRHEPAERSVTVLAFNDVYRIAGVDGGERGGPARLRTLRRELEEEDPDLLVLHAGDALFPSILSRLYDGGQMVDVLNHLDGDGGAFDERMFITFGNHELDGAKLADAPNLDRQVEGSRFRWLSSNIVFAGGPGGRPLIEADNLRETAILDAGGVRVGLFGLSTDMKSTAYIAEFRGPVEAARGATARLREQGAELVIGLTHLTLEEDSDLLRELGDEGPDVIFGGHEHERQQRQVGGRWILKADAEARTATVARITLKPQGPPRVEFEFRELGPQVPEDPALEAVVEGWLDRFDREYCGRLNEPPGCLDEPLGRTALPLIAEELEIRRFETNLGDWAADLALEAFADRGAQIAFLNSGAFRLNQNLPAGARITRRHVEELFAYPTPLRLLRLRGSVLGAALDHAVSDWTGNGHWLQVAGFAYVHDPDSGTASDLTLLTAEGGRPIDPEEDLLAVVNEFLVDPAGGQDDFTMLGPGQVVRGTETAAPDLKQLVIEALLAADDGGVAPEVEGRICNTTVAGPCLADIGGR